ncbi:hypothetical protein BJV77DRAFT_959646 [Russula vinacea]|nr:hypothetical protein BJV77DRAFT_959646 [Russula vinacea]
MTLWVPRARRSGFGRFAVPLLGIFFAFDRNSREDLNSYGKSPSIPRLFKLIPILERRQFYNGTFWRPLQVLTALSLLYCHGMDERQSCRAKDHFLTVTRARTFCRDGLVGAAGGLNSSVLIDYDNEHLTTYSDPWDPPGAVVLPRAATYDMVAVYSEGRRARSSESDIGLARPRELALSGQGHGIVRMYCRYCIISITASYRASRTTAHDSELQIRDSQKKNSDGNLRKTTLDFPCDFPYLFPC